MATIFVGGFVAIPVLGRWARHVTEVLAFLLAITVVMVASMYLCNRWPQYYANPRNPVAVAAAPSAH
ncbi:hypothetical protein MMMDOFMJ_0079 [Methylobacterium gnaphalii]|uniref:Uncharacterized protein n=2 Tax=Methylobacterium gnaphalii TaxID=1010610 RepID=A0A512JMX7_9HYPH|nr:hypothetical protein MGN01_31620 [Methylobacterium gnaphalii]GJD67165.1 hypothetical protein MMMDOFMJ_0079 [Methylobacterium gnaphalii]GLS50017.1 hypothetical protein GCM10007885_28690 [Methylobacterium gnaphalii]